ncbi:MAG TPA: energy transducer TonB [Steroidobacteraceae bacterium]|jgi:protein TonB|nr:energy transducer TonB [Steroidobacteraceae bacterium]
MAVQIFNDMPDVAVHRGDPDYDLLRELNAPRKTSRFSGRAGFVAATVAVHLIAAVALMNMRHDERVATEPEPIVATMFEAPQAEAEAPPLADPPIDNVVYALPAPPDLSFESDPIAPEITTAIATPTAAQTITPPLVESIEYLHAVKPVFPRESQRKHEYGTVLVRVLVDILGRPAQLQIERTSGYERLDNAALRCVEQFRFRPHEVNGVAQPAQVLIPVGFDPPA